MNYSRRDFLKKSALAGASVVTAGALGRVEPALGATSRTGQTRITSASNPFHLKYAPTMSMFSAHAGKGLAENIQFCHENGFRAMFDNSLMSRSEADQELIASEIKKHGMELGPFVLYADFSVTSLVLDSQDVRTMLEAKMKEGVACSKRTGVKQALLVPGRYDERLFPGYQLAHVIDNLRFCCDIVEKAGLTLVLEPLNRRDHPGLFLTDMPQAYAVCRAVNRPSCKIVDDMYHQQISEGNIIPHIDQCWDEIGAFHLGDNPGRNEPGTGEINYKNIFKHLHEKGCDKVICMEHGKSVSGLEGEKRLLQAYRTCDDF